MTNSPVEVEPRAVCWKYSVAAEEEGWRTLSELLSLSDLLAVFVLEFEFELEVVEVEEEFDEVRVNEGLARSICCDAMLRDRLAMICSHFFTHDPAPRKLLNGVTVRANGQAFFVIWLGLNRNNWVHQGTRDHLTINWPGTKYQLEGLNMSW